MRILICGSRFWTDRKAVLRVILTLDPLKDELVVGDCPTGADFIAAEQAIERNITTHVICAHWTKHGLAAGPIRNSRMIDEFKPQIVYAFPIESSRGTKDTIRKARKAGIQVILPE